ncbi:hypothetical protein CN198_14680 [Sinorhizobium meliloti]|uniref:hypothetical protein n=1 Tax=Rhizobium meliloti TaxID=382 RepID=UPI000FDA3A3A|nr:hypothetical protein [Sinorhizobium meliloti]MDW9936586.1 hypothetical protein [Sinorhizobium meliloti]MDX0395837.1 hypothetical protein [Sinorhizobium meliloti]RVH68897.1 hypothetical protein CN198_14680 [Sinorhizobium meliloti]
MNVYPTSQIKRGPRATKAEVESRRAALFSIVQQHRPMTVRQVFYQATVRGIIDKTEHGYLKIQDDLTKMRRTGTLPYGWLTDSTRMQRSPTTYDDLGQFMRTAAALYRRSLWTDANCQVEVWIEKDALAGVIYPVTQKWDVPLMSARGYASLSFLHSAAEDIAHNGRPAFIYHLGDYDPSGVNAAAKIEETLRDMVGDRAEIHFERLAVTEDQIRDFDLPTRPTKKTDSRAKRFGSELSVELDAIEPETLRTLVEQHIWQHVDHAQLKVIEAAEESERDFLRTWRDQYGR